LKDIDRLKVSQEYSDKPMIAGNLYRSISASTIAAYSGAEINKI